MKPWKTAALAAALTGAAAAGAAYAPTVQAQSPRTVAPRAVEIFGGGSRIGVSIKDVEENDAKAAKLTQPGGVLIEEVEEDSPASRAGIKKGDVIVEFDGERVRSARQFARLVQETPAGRKAAASVIRDGQRLTLTIEPRESNALSRLGDLDAARVFRDFGRDFRFDMPMPPAPPAAPVPPAPPTPPVPPSLPDFETFVWRSGNTLGMTVGDLSDQLAGYFGVKDGVLVTSVADDSAAAKAGIKAGDVVTSFNGEAVSQPSDLRRRVQRLQDGDEFTVGVVRDKKSLTLKGKAETTRPRRTSRTVI
jgi:S1-C subfamily serine protease